MILVQAPAEMAVWSAHQRRAGRRVGFVPTMGALHAGHMALVDHAREHGDAVVASVFVNPLQFNNADDLRNYPRTLEADRALLEAHGCHALFAPDQERIFAGHTPHTYDLGTLNEVLEGPSRPGHFQGVVNVVERLFHYVRPEEAFFGEKDRQQLAVIEHVARMLRWPERIIGLPTVRETDGLAMSSRNTRLSPDQRGDAPVLFRALQAVAAHAYQWPVGDCLEAGLEVLRGTPSVRLDYLEVANATTLRPVRVWAGDRCVVLIAAWLGPVRLIDNITLSR